MSLRLRLTLWYAVVLAAVLLMVFFSLQRFLNSWLLAEVDSRLESYAQEISSAISTSRAEGGATYQRVVRSIAREGFGAVPLFARVVSPDGEMVAFTLDMPTEFAPPDREALARVVSQGPFFDTGRARDGGELRLYSVPLEEGGRVNMVVQVGESLRAVASAITKLRQILIVASVVALVAAAMTGYLLAWQGLRPLDEVVALAEAVRGNQLGRRLAKKRRPAEVQRLADAFHSMLERLDQAFQQQRRFAYDVSHEVRTPLTALRGQIDVMLLDPDLPSGVRASLQRMAQECSRLIRLTSNLLLLASQEGGRPLNLARVDLDDLLIEVYQEAKVLAQDHVIRIDEQDQVAVRGDRDLLKQMMLNLVDNAIKYTPEGGTVILFLGRQGTWARFAVQDTGVGIAPEDLPSIFKPFYRARQPQRGRGGAGLGLAIVDWVVHSHHGQVRVESTVGKGSTFEVLLPLSESSLQQPSTESDAADSPALPTP
ncbi:MAG: HAMP domain-containing protein [Chloroflexi bacterium]|nr:HAMP domain-containing protein [Chloroflexota bacterium]